MTTDHDIGAALRAAVDTARLAPSIHNTQPWHWRLERDRLLLFADRSRQLPVEDPDGLLLTQSCGTALHHALITLDAEGWQAQTHRLPDPADPDLLAEITIAGRGHADPAAAVLVQTALDRRTDRRPVAREPVGDTVLQLIATAAAAAAESTYLYLLRPEQVADLSVAMSHADETETREREHREEIARWVGGTRADATGIPDAAIPDRPPRTGVPGRYFGSPGTLRVDDGNDRDARYGILHGDMDDPAAWLRAGEALSAAWLTAARHRLSFLPISAVVEVGATRERLRGLLSGLGYPYLAVRIGRVEADRPGPPATPRLPAEQILDVTA
jgi:nitroreductase